MNTVRVLNYQDDNNNDIISQEVAVGICTGTLYDDFQDHDLDVTAEYSYPLASAAFINTNQTLTDDFLILSNTEDNDYSFDDIVFAQPIDDSIENGNPITKNRLINNISQSNSISLPFDGITTIRDELLSALNSIDVDNNNSINNNALNLIDDDASVSIKLHDLGYDLSSIEKDDLLYKKTFDEEDYIDNNNSEAFFTIDSNSYEEKLRALLGKDNSVQMNSLLSNSNYKNECKKNRDAAIRKWKQKRNKRMWLKVLPESKNRSQAAKKRSRDLTGTFKSRITTNTKIKIPKKKD